ncbi:hypothetical protein B296_00044056 [Ensete ventricosum]|uniref:Uncharacterized protein n=1 Tax=Ensete ventricosum TaxID=4639 RepID=A0A426X497_ENSVE|nr:hypothetical protein B296_00044056 [Ensete ventricosum]
MTSLRGSPHATRTCEQRVPGEMTRVSPVDALPSSLANPTTSWIRTRVRIAGDGRWRRAREVANHGGKNGLLPSPLTHQINHASFSCAHTTITPNPHPPVKASPLFHLSLTLPDGDGIAERCALCAVQRWMPFVYSGSLSLIFVRTEKRSDLAGDLFLLFLDPEVRTVTPPSDAVGRRHPHRRTRSPHSSTVPIITAVLVPQLLSWSNGQLSVSR